MRYDSFIIWGNGLNYISDIMSIIRNDGNYNIIRIVTRNIDNMKEFIKDVYRCDTVPWHHLVAKSKYLLSSPKKCVFILVENKEPEESYFGQGEFRHIQCQKINNTKKIIRSNYNPPFSDSNKVIPPLPKGVSHNHCIHATDYESQVEYLLNYFNLKNLDYYRKYKNHSHYIPWHLSGVNNYNLIEIELTNLFANIGGKAIKIEHTPHYQYVLENKEVYVNYFNNNFGINLQEDHFPESFDNLIKNLNENYIREDGKKSHIIINSRNIILDGVHRAAILKSKGVDKVKCIQIL